MELLFITPQEASSSTILSGNIDIDKFLFCIANVQLTTIEPLLGTELYDKIVAEKTAGTLAGDYLTLFNDFIKPITKHESVAQFIEIASYIVDNGGIYKHSAEGKEVVDKQEAQFLSGKSKAMSQMYVQRFNKWISYNSLPEYKKYQDEVNAIKDIKLMTEKKI